MIFIGFGFLMTFLKRYGYSATGLNLFVAALVVQWAILMRGFFELEDGVIKCVSNFHGRKLSRFTIFFYAIRLSLLNLIGADIAAASVLISMGALLGRISPIQLLVMGLFEIVLFACNEFLQIELMKVNVESKSSLEILMKSINSPRTDCRCWRVDNRSRFRSLFRARS